MVQVYVYYCILGEQVIYVVFLEVDQEWFFGGCVRQVGGILVFVQQEQVFVLFEIQQGYGLLCFCFGFFVQEDWIFMLQFGEFVGIGQYYVYCIVELWFEFGGDFQVLMCDVVEYFIVGYQGIQFSVGWLVGRVVQV